MHIIYISISILQSIKYDSYLLLAIEGPEEITPEDAPPQARPELQKLSGHLANQ